VPLGIAVNPHSERYYDEGEDLWPKRYAIWGRLIAEQPDQQAFAVADSKVWGRFIPPMYPPYREDTIEGLAVHCGLDPAALARTVHAFNAAVVDEGPWDPNSLDGRRTTGLAIPKSNWRSGSTPLPTTPTHCGPASPSPTSASRSTSRPESYLKAERPFPTCSRPARSWRATSLWRVTWVASG
jgi:tricarballylate dehydrogenase